MNFKRRSEMGKRVMTESQVIAKLKDMSDQMMSTQKLLNPRRTHTFDTSSSDAPVVAYRPAHSRTNDPMVIAWAPVLGSRYWKI